MHMLVTETLPRVGPVLLAVARMGRPGATVPAVGTQMDVRGVRTVRPSRYVMYYVHEYVHACMRHVVRRVSSACVQLRAE